MCGKEEKKGKGKEEKKEEKNGDQIAKKEKKKSVRIFFLYAVIIFWINQKYTI